MIRPVIEINKLNNTLIVNWNQFRVRGLLILLVFIIWCD